MIWKKPSEQVTGNFGVPSLVKFWMTPFQSCSRMPEFTWKRQRSISAYFRSVSLASCVITRSALPKVKRTLSEVPLMSCEIRTSEPGSPIPIRRGR